MAVPTLLFVTCISCTSSAPEPVQVSDSSCSSAQHQERSEPLTAPVSPCLNTPETAVAFMPEFSPTEQLSSQTITLQPAFPSIQPEEFSSVTWSKEIASVASSPLLQTGRQGQAVIDLQTKLNQFGYYLADIDGIYGAATQTAVMQFQQAHGLNPDGIVGSETWAVLHQAPSAPKAFTLPTTPQPTQAVATPEQPSPQPSPPEPSPPEQSSPANPADPPSRLTRSLRINPPPSQTYLWLIAGWTVVYMGGWVLILKEGRKELQKLKLPSTSLPQKNPKDFDTALKHLAELRQAEEKSLVRLPQLRKEPQASSHSTSPTPELEAIATDTSAGEAIPWADLPQPVAQLPPEPVDRLTVVAADEGRIEPLQDLIVDINHWIAPHPEVEPYLPQHLPQPIRAEMPVAHTPAITEPVIAEHQPAQSVPPVAQAPAEAKDDEETLVATLPTAEDTQHYTYSLVEDADGLFVLRGNELRVVHHLLSQTRSNEQLIVLRRIDSQGTAVDQSFKFAIQKKHQPAQPELAVA